MCVCVVREPLLSKLNISSYQALSSAIWAGPGLLATAVGDNMVRMLDLSAEENYVLSLGKEKGEFSSSDVLVALAFDTRGSVLAAAATSGFVYFWKKRGDAAAAESWVFQAPPSELNGPLVALGFGGRSLLAVQSEEQVSILREHIMRKSFGRSTGAVQVRG